ncbi:MAG TPA: hypothetical protein VF625_00155 [Longimicrobium sp.]|jgi:hypothetical protein
MPHTSTTFAPSELVLLHGARFAGPASLTQGKEELLAGGSVGANSLAESLLAVTLLAMEDAGAIRLVHEARKTLFGLMTKKSVAVEATGAGPAFPAGTLEAELLATIRKGRAEVGDVIYEWMGTDHKWPRAVVLEQVRNGLVGRGLVHRQEKRTLKIIVTHTDTLPDSTRQLLDAHPPAPLLALIDAARARDDLFPTLEKRIRAGLNLRQESDND